ncbi:MAG: tetratricopeptide repeat protein [Pyrinomonadaceae bacterium]
MFKLIRPKSSIRMTPFAALTVLLLCSASVLCARSKDLSFGIGSATKASATSPRRPRPATTRRPSVTAKLATPVVKAPVEISSPEIDVYKELSEKDPDNPSTWASFAFVHYRAKRYEEAVALYRRAIELRATATWCYQLGHALSSLGRHREAIAAFDQALSLDSSLNIARYALALCYAKTGDPRSAAKQAEILSGFNSQMAASLRRDLKSGRIK